MFSESLKGVGTQKFPGAFAPRPPQMHRSLKYLDPPLSATDVDGRYQQTKTKDFAFFGLILNERSSSLSLFSSIVGLGMESLT